MSSYESLYFLDIYAFGFNLIFKNKAKFHTFLGGISGFFSIIFFLIIILVYFINLFKRKDFDIISTIEKNYNAPIYLNTKIMFAFVDSEGNDIINDRKLLTINLNYFSFNQPILNIPLEICNSSSLNFLNKLNYLYCADLNNLTLMEKEYENDYSFIYFDIEKCNDDCYDDLEMEEKLEKSVFYLYVPEYEINHFNFSYPIKQINSLHSLNFNSKFHKIYEYKYSVINYLTDNGFLFTKIENYIINYIDQYNFDITDITDSPTIGIIRFISNGKNQKYNRRYSKIQDIIANIGALIKIIKIIIKLITCFFTRKIYLQELVNSIMFKNNLKKKHNRNAEKKFSKTYLNLNKEYINPSEIQLKEIEDKHSLKLLNKKKGKTVILNSKSCNVKKTENILNNIQVTPLTETKYKLGNLYQKIIQDNRFSNIKLKWYNYFTPNFLIKKNKNIIILEKCKEEIYKNISIEKIYSTIENNKDEFLIALYKEILNIKYFNY